MCGGDTERDFRVDLQTRAVDGKTLERLGDEIVVSVRTQTGGVYTSPIDINFVNDSRTGTSTKSDASYDLFIDPTLNPQAQRKFRPSPFTYALSGGEAK